MSFPAEGPLDALLKDMPVVEPPTPAPVHVDKANILVDDKLCMHAHPNGDSPDMLHAVWSADISQVEGVMASVASVVATTSSPLTIHLMVQKFWLDGYKERFGVRPECHGTVTVTGVLILIHEIDPNMVKPSIAKITKEVLQVRGQLDSVENYARFYMHMLMERTVVIYLDADTIVQADIAQLRRELIKSKKTIGFVDRPSGKNRVGMNMFLTPKNRCKLKVGSWKKLLKATAYNAGVYAVDLKRWAEKGVDKRVEELVAKHNACGGKLWTGGSQPPLLLAFLIGMANEDQDFIVFDAAWNAGDLGWKLALKEKSLRTQYVLHWNGGSKPWKEGGLYAELWRPHREAFPSLCRPFDAVGRKGAGEGDAKEETAAGASQGSATKADKSSTKMDEEKSASLALAEAACPGVKLVDEWQSDHEASQCEIGGTYGCPPLASPVAKSSMWVKTGCSGLFNVGGRLTVCGGEDSQCSAGSMPKPTSSCGIMILTSYFTTLEDWQRKQKVTGNFSKMRKFYQGVMQLGLNASMIYDELPDAMITTYASDRFQFLKVDLNDFNRRYGVNDVRYFYFQRLVLEHEEWKTVWIVDAFDVQVVMNPCPGIRDGMLYIGHELDKLKKHPWMEVRFKKMGGKYLEWFQNVPSSLKILNCGLTGGRRDMMLKLLDRMTTVLKDPAIAIMSKEKEEINLNMAALNWILYTEFGGRFTGNKPMHSQYKRYQKNRKDVWFIHK